MIKYSNFGAYKLPKLEECIAGYQYAFTFNPRPLKDSSWKRTYNQISYVLQAIPIGICNWSVNHEFSPRGKLHVHGYITILNIPRFYAEIVPYLIENGTFEIDTIGDDGYEWDKYIHKQKHFSKEFLNSFLMPIQYNCAEMHNEKSWPAHFAIQGCKQSMTFEKVLGYNQRNGLSEDLEG